MSVLGSAVGFELRRDEPLAPRTSFELGGNAEYFVEARADDELIRALEWARSHGVPIALLGGGSNVIVPDEGVAGLVVVPATRGVVVEDVGAQVDVTAAAGEPWDAFVGRCVDAGHAGLECLSGIPGSVGATPIQNVGAYGVETSDRLVSVDVYDRRERRLETLDADELGFAYRDSALKRDPSRYVVLRARFRLDRGGAPTIRYAELAAATDDSATIAEVRATVIRLRRAKSMVLDPDDPNRRSAGSFFTNPIVTAAEAEHVVATALRIGVADDAKGVPRWVQPDGRVKLAAGWLIERSGIAKGLERGHVGVSTKHALALVHHGGGSTAELLSLANEVVATVLGSFGVTLEREPVILSGSRDS